MGMDRTSERGVGSSAARVCVCMCIGGPCESLTTYTSVALGEVLPQGQCFQSDLRSRHLGGFEICGLAEMARTGLEGPMNARRAISSVHSHVLSLAGGCDRNKPTKAPCPNVIGGAGRVQGDG